MKASELMSAGAVRHSSQHMLADAKADRLLHWRVDLTVLREIAKLVARISRENYPDLRIPFHSRWRHFGVGGIDRWGDLSSRMDTSDRLEKARSAFDLVILSVLVDAGTGGKWTYFDAATQANYSSSEGLAIASVNLYEGRARDKNFADWLRGLTTTKFAQIFQISTTNPLNGMEGRTSLLNRLGEICLARPEFFASAGEPRPGGLVDIFVKESIDGRVHATVILDGLLNALGEIWPSRLAFEGVPLGDAWFYPPWATSSELQINSIVPFHKLSQWLTYSLIEPLQQAGLEVIGIGELTGLAEYRNGGLFVDANALQLKIPGEASILHTADSNLVIEWRAMTVALLDLLHPLVAKELGLTLTEFPLARMLEGGTWAAGRYLAKQLRTDGNPPISIVSDGTVF